MCFALVTPTLLDLRGNDTGFLGNPHRGIRTGEPIRSDVTRIADTRWVLEEVAVRRCKLPFLKMRVWIAHVSRMPKENVTVQAICRIQPLRLHGVLPVVHSMGSADHRRIWWFRNPL